MHTHQKQKQNLCKTLNSRTLMLLFTGPLPVQCAGGRRPGSLAPAPQDCSTSEVFSPRTVLTENICRRVQQRLQHFPATMPFLTTSTITLSCLASAAPQADSWWLGHVEPDDVDIADIGGQALDIFLRGPESAHKNGIVETNVHSHIHSHSPMQTPKTNKDQSLNSPNVTPSFSCPLYVHCGRGRLPGSLADAPRDWSTSKAFSPRTVLTENISWCVQQHRPATMPLLTTPTILLSCLASAAPQTDSWWFRHMVADDVVIADTGGCGHISPLSRVSTQEWYRKDKHSLTHPFPSTHAHS